MLLSFKYFILLFSNLLCTQLKVEGETIKLDGKSRVSVSILMRNCSDTNNLYYNFKGEPIFGLREEMLCDGESSAGFGVVVYNKDSKFMHPRESISDSVHGQSPEKLFEYLELSKRKFRDNRIILNKGEAYHMNLIFDLKEYHLKKGEYTLLLIFSSGRGIGNEIDEESIREDEAASKSKTFFGCVKSNSVKLIVP